MALAETKVPASMVMRHEVGAIGLDAAGPHMGLMVTGWVPQNRGQAQRQCTPSPEAQDLHRCPHPTSAFFLQLLGFQAVIMSAYQ